MEVYRKGRMWALSAEGEGQIGTSYLRQEGSQAYQPTLQCQVLQEEPTPVFQKQ